MRPSSATAVSSSRATTPVARLAYHIQVDELAAFMLITMRCQAKHGLGATYEADLIRWRTGAPQLSERYRAGSTEHRVRYPPASPMVCLQPPPGRSAVT